MARDDGRAKRARMMVGRQPDRREENERVIRRDSHLALGCGFAFALVVTATLIIYYLAGT